VSKHPRGSGRPAYAKQGPTITITFEAATELEPGKTQLKYRDVAVGVVKTVSLSDDLSHVIVTAQMDKAASEHLREGTQFWVESVRLEIDVSNYSVRIPVVIELQPQRASVVVRDDTMRAAARSPSYEDRVAALSQALGDLSSAIAGALAPLQPGEAAAAAHR